jgi:hypothetical protein
VKTPQFFLGIWRIIETKLWDKDALDLVAPARITFTEDGFGTFPMVAIQGEIDPSFYGRRVEFSWTGDDDGSEVTGRGWAQISTVDKLRGRIFIHRGDESSSSRASKKK